MISAHVLLRRPSLSCVQRHRIVTSKSAECICGVRVLDSQGVVFCLCCKDPSPHVDGHRPGVSLIDQASSPTWVRARSLCSDPLVHGLSLQPNQCLGSHSLPLAFSSWGQTPITHPLHKYTDGSWPLLFHVKIKTACQDFDYNCIASVLQFGKN